MSALKVKRAFTSSLVFGAVVFSTLIAPVQAASADDVNLENDAKCSHFTGQQGRPVGPHSGAYEVPDELKEHVERTDIDIPVEYVDNPNLKQGETRIVQEGSHPFDLYGPAHLDSLDTVSDYSNLRHGVDTKGNEDPSKPYYIVSRVVPGHGDIGTIQVPKSATPTTYNIKIDNIDSISNATVKMISDNDDACGYKEYKSVYAKGSMNTVHVAAGVTKFYVTLQGGRYIRQGGPFDKGPVKITVTDDKGNVILQQDYTDIYAVYYGNTVDPNTSTNLNKAIAWDYYWVREELAIPAKPRIIERGTAPVVTTKYVDETGKEIKPVAEEITAQPEADIPGYKFDKTEVVNGVTVHHYTALPKPAETPVETPVEPTQTPAPKLPDTGTDTLGALLASLAVSMLGAVMLVIRKRKS